MQRRAEYHADAGAGWFEDQRLVPLRLRQYELPRDAGGREDRAGHAEGRSPRARYPDPGSLNVPLPWIAQGGFRQGQLLLQGRQPGRRARLLAHQTQGITSILIDYLCLIDYVRS